MSRTASNRTTPPEPDHPLVGTWRLRSWVAIDDDGTSSTPMGEAAEGLLVYSADGTMIALLGRSGRPAFATDEVTGGGPDEQAAAFTSFVAYGGPYEIDGDTVVHEVAMSLFPNWVGTSQRRRWTLAPGGASLILESPPLRVRGGTRIQRLTWERSRG